MPRANLGDATIVFDLDGTLVDTAHDLIAALNFVLEREGLSPLPLKSARNMIGAGARKMIERGLDPQKGQDAVLGLGLLVTMDDKINPRPEYEHFDYPDDHDH